MTERTIAKEWKSLRNKRMAEKLTDGRALSVLAIGDSIGGGLYKLREFVDDVDYCDPAAEAWIWSIGRNRATGEIFASTSGGLYQDEAWECLWLR
jgi:hypothetical protein